MSKKTSAIGKIYQALIYVFLYAPILVIGLFSFNGSANTYMLQGFSTHWYQELFSNAAAMHALQNTVVLALCTAAVSTLLGVMAAVGIFNSRHKLYKRSLMLMTNVPMMNPEIVTAIGLLMFFSSLGVNKGLTTMLLAHIMFCTPYVILSVTPKLRSLDPNLADAALDLGATPLQALTKVIVPQIMPGIVSGALIAFTMSFDDFVISYFVTGNGVNNISILVYTMSKRVNPSINALSTLVIALITVVLIIVNVVPIIREKRRTKA